VEGSDTTAFLTIIEVAKKYVHENGVAVNDINVQKYVAEKVRWFASERIPSVEKVGYLIIITDRLGADSLAKACFDDACVKWGRSCALAQESLVVLICQKCATKDLFTYVLQGLYVEMRRSGNTCKLAASDIRSKCSLVQVWKFNKMFAEKLVAAYPVKVEGKDQEDLKQRAEKLLKNPVQWLEFLVDRKWLAGLPILYQKLMDRVESVYFGIHVSAVKGLLANPPAGGATYEAFQKLDKSEMWTKEFEILYKESLGITAEAKEMTTGDGGKENPGGQPLGGPVAEDDEGAVAKRDTHADLRAKMKEKAEILYSQRVIDLIGDGSANKLGDLFNAQKVCLSLKDSGCMGYYDVKVARMPERLNKWLLQSLKRNLNG